MIDRDPNKIAQEEYERLHRMTRKHDYKPRLWVHPTNGKRYLIDDHYWDGDAEGATLVPASAQKTYNERAKELQRVMNGGQWDES